MATVNFSVPEDVKREFDRTFAGRNKSAILSELMRRAVAEEEEGRRRKAAARRILERRGSSPVIPAAELAKTRRSGRP